jgi:stage V sporulation protein B
VSENKNTFVKGVAILGIAGLIGKVIGAFYRVPLTHIIGTDGMGLYQIAYPIYSFLVLLSSAGLPTAISKLVAERIVSGDYRGAHRVFQVAFQVLAVMGIASTAFLAALSYPLAVAVGDARAMLSLLCLSPALLFVSVICAYRGYFQGLQQMVPTALSQIIEQIGKLIFGFALAMVMGKNGVVYAAAGAVLGVSISEAIALVGMIVAYNRHKPQLKKNIRASIRRPKPRFKKVAISLARVAVPITIGSSMMPLVNTLDTAVVIRRLQSIPELSDGATSLFGILTGMINPLINMPAVLTLSLSMALVPAIAACIKRGDQLGTHSTSALGFRMALWVGLPAALGMYLLADPIMHLLYGSQSAEKLLIGGNLLRSMSVAVLFLSLNQTMAGILQGIGRVFLPVRNILIGAAFKLILNFVLVGIPAINIQGAAVGTIACYAVASVLSAIDVIRYTRMKFSIGDFLLRPLTAAVGMGLTVWAFDHFLSPHLGTAIGTLGAVAVGAAVYLLLLVVVRGVKPSDMRMIPGGRRITALLVKAHIW